MFAAITFGIMSAIAACTVEEDNRGGIFGDRPTARPSSDASADVRDAAETSRDAAVDVADARDDGG